MIEMIYDKREDNKRDMVNDIALPKNIRQIGSPAGDRRIYIEDYVVTYLNQLSKPGNLYSRGAILLGETIKTMNQEVMFISGAVEATNFELDLDETVFTNETWSNIYSEVKSYFPDLEVVGWFLSRMGFGIDVNDKICKTHIDNFPGNDKVLYVIDSLEDEDSFYMYDRGSLKRQNGYYIYYVKNDAMQNYIISKREKPEEADEVTKKDEELVKNYKTLLEESKNYSNEKVLSNVMYIASCFIILGVMALGITVLNNYGRMKSMEDTITSLKTTEENVISSESVAAEDVSTEANITSEAAYDLENETPTEEAMATSESTTETATQAALPAISNGSPTYYTVKSGDSFSTISFAMYNTTKYVNEILSANNMTGDDKLYPGDQIIIPSIN